MSLYTIGLSHATAPLDVREKVTFAPGETCKVVTGSILGDDVASATASTAVKAAVVDTQGAVIVRGDHHV